jgi:flagellar biosynthesis/type III secretory pathway M-ring protein FliF/YscJ
VIILAAVFLILFVVWIVRRIVRRIRGAAQARAKARARTPAQARGAPAGGPHVPEVHSDPVRPEETVPEPEAPRMWGDPSADERKAAGGGCP